MVLTAVIKYVRMDKMNKLRGEAYERFVFGLLQKQIREGRVGDPLFDVTAHHHRRYKAKSGNRIDTDISVEVRRKGTGKRMLLIIIECKTYVRFQPNTLHLNDLQAKMTHIGAHKGYLVTTSALTKGVKMQAAHYGIGLIRLPMNGRPEWIAERRKEMDEAATRARIGDCEMSSIERLARQAEQAAGIHRLPDKRLDDADLLRIPRCHGFAVFHDRLPPGVRGLCNFFDRTIWLSTAMRPGSAHWRLTLAHEIGHIILHSDSDACVCRESSRDLDTATRLREQQAEAFARVLLIPPDVLPASLHDRDARRLLARHYGVTMRELPVSA